MASRVAQRDAKRQRQKKKKKEGKPSTLIATREFLTLITQNYVDLQKKRHIAPPRLKAQKVPHQMLLTESISLVYYVLFCFPVC